MNTTEIKDKTCKEQVKDHLKSRIKTIRSLLKYYCKNKPHPEYGELFEYGLSFDYVEPWTFSDQPAGYWRYQLSWGGPSDEFRFYVDSENNVRRIHYWFDGAGLNLTGKCFSTMEEVFHIFKYD